MEKYKASRGINEENSEMSQVDAKSAKEEKELNATNNVVKTGLNVAEHIPVTAPYAKAAKLADKITGGAVSKTASKIINTSLKQLPLGNKIQGVINKVGNSGSPKDSTTESDTEELINAEGVDANGSNSQSNQKSSLFNNPLKSNNNSNNNGVITPDISKQLTKMIPKSLKIKICIGAGCLMLSLLLFFTVFAEQDEVNMGVTNSPQNFTTGSTSYTVDASMYNGGTASMMSSGETLLSRLGQTELDAINSKIINDVNVAGSGTGAGVATAAYTFIKELLDRGINMTYTYGGGHGGQIPVGLDGSWGAGNGIDCSAFVSWAMFNGGCKSHTTAVVSGTQATYGVETTADKLLAGDIVANSSHVMLILENKGSSVIIAHASSASVGIVFDEKTYAELSGYQLRDMSSYYQQNCSS